MFIVKSTVYILLVVQQAYFGIEVFSRSMLFSKAHWEKWLGVKSASGRIFHIQYLTKLQTSAVTVILVCSKFVRAVTPQGFPVVDISMWHMEQCRLLLGNRGSHVWPEFPQWQGIGTLLSASVTSPFFLTANLTYDSDGQREGEREGEWQIQSTFTLLRLATNQRKEKESWLRLN